MGGEVASRVVFGWLVFCKRRDGVLGFCVVRVADDVDVGARVDERDGGGVEGDICILVRGYRVHGGVPPRNHAHGDSADEHVGGHGNVGAGANDACAVLVH